MTSAMPTTNLARVDKWTMVALFSGLVAFPALYANDVLERLLFAASPGLLRHLLDDSSRLGWWYFAGEIFLLHWAAFLMVALALRKNGETWSSIGIEWSWFEKHKWSFAALISGLAACAIVLPGVFYADGQPARSSLGFIGPVSAAERLFVIVIAITAGVTEEVVFRGFALTRLKRWVPNIWSLLPVSALSFVFIHGEFEDWVWFANYFAAGIAFGVPFILMKLRNLHFIIVAHFLINASIVLAP